MELKYSTVFLAIMIIAIVVLITILVKKSNKMENELKNTNIEAYEAFNKKLNDTSIVQLYYENTINPPIQFIKNIFAN